MEYDEAAEMRRLLKYERYAMEDHPDRSKMFYLPILVKLEIDYLEDELETFYCTYDDGMDQDGTEILDRVYEEEMNMRLSNRRISLFGGLMNCFHIDYGLSRVLLTERFIDILKAEMKVIENHEPPFRCTIKFIQKVLVHTEAYLKKQRISEYAVFGPKDYQKIDIDCDAAVAMRDGLQKERILIKNNSRMRDKFRYLLEFLDAEIDRLCEEIATCIRAMKESDDKIKVPTEGALLLSRMPAEYGLSCAEEIEKFIEALYTEFEILEDSVALPLTVQLIHRVIGYAETYLMEKRPYETAYIGAEYDSEDSVL